MAMDRYTDHFTVWKPRFIVSQPIPEEIKHLNTEEMQAALAANVEIGVIVAATKRWWMTRQLKE